jgi:RND family efflux transporter MFP subunit
LATLSTTDEDVKVLEAQANLAAARASLKDLQTGAKTEAVEIKKSSLTKAQSDIDQAYKNAGDSIKNIGIYGGTYVKENFANYFDGNSIEGYRLNIPACDASLESRVGALRLEAVKALQNIENIVNSYSSYDPNTQKEKLLQIKNFYAPSITDYLQSLKNVLALPCLAVNSNYDSARTIVNSSNNNWSTLNSDLSTKINSLENSKILLDQAESDLKLSQTGEKNEKIKQQESVVQGLVARLEAVKLELRKNILSSPFAGIITDIDLKKGELVSVGEKKISIISNANFQIESKVSEVDVAKLKTGAQAKVTFDAYGDENIFDAVVSNISMGGIISDGIPTYKTIFDFLNKDERVRSGMTANVDVVINTRENVLSVPAKFVQNKNGSKVVQVAKPGDLDDIEERKVKLGSRGSNGEVEILEGLNAGELVILQKGN